jgi:ABC-type transport system involved in multi-copper enzyme maturation permease subunit
MRLGQWGLARLLDPLGYTPLHALWRSYNLLQRKTLAGLDASIIWNRLSWLGVAAAVLAFAYARFRFAHATGGGGWRHATLVDDAPAVRWTGITVPAARRVFGFSARMRQLRAIAMRSFHQLVTSRGWWIVPIVAAIFVVTAPELLEVELGAPGAATTARVAAIIGGTETARLIVLLIALSAGELVWRERDARMSAIADVTPVPEWLSVAGKFLGLALMLAAAELIFLLSGVGVQAMGGYHHYDLALYVKILFGFQLTGYLLVAALAMFLHVVVNQKYVANILVMVAFIGTEMAREIGVEHNLLLYGGAPEWSYSEMGGFGPQVGPWLWFTLYWTGWALLLAVATYLFWIRGAENGFRARLALARQRLTRSSALAGATAMGIIIGAGGYVFYNTNVLNRYSTDAEIEQRMAEYERRYRGYAAVPQPVLTGTKLLVDFYPKRGTATIRGTYSLENRGGAAIDTIHLATHSGVKTHNVSFDRPSRATLVDDKLHHHAYTLGRALQPGQSMRMHFEIAYAPRGFTNYGRDATVMHNGSWIEHRGEQTHQQRRWLPVLGYEPGRELSGTVVRANHGLPARPAVPSLQDAAARNEQRGREKIAFEAIVGTDGDQVGVTSGVLHRTWTEHGRNYSHYVADAPISNGFVIYSANYAVHRASWRPANGAGHEVAIEIFHHPAHTENLERMVHGARASLDYHTRHYSPYPFRQLRMIEFPSSGRGLGLSAHNGAIKFSEGYALVRPDEDPRRIDFPFAVMAHEMGHQWWGHQLVPAGVEGAPLLSESLAWYSAMLTVEQTFGREHLLRVLEVMREEYMAPHMTRDVSLLRAVDRIDAYRTGPFAMYALRELIGADRVNGALRNLLAKFDPRYPPYPTSLDWYAELRAATPPDQHSLLKDLFEEVTFWDLRTKKVDVQPSGRGTYRVTLQVEAQKLKADALGKEKPVPMADLIELAVFDADGRALYRQPHRIRSGEQTVTVVVTGQPASAGLDPDHELLDRKPGDNVSGVPR